MTRFDWAVITVAAVLAVPGLALWGATILERHAQRLLRKRPGETPSLYLPRHLS